MPSSSIDPNDRLISLLGAQVAGDIGQLTIYTNRNGRKVAYPKSPPQEVPTFFQVQQRERFRQAIDNWRNLTQNERDQWEQLSRRAYAPATGHNLFIHYSFSRDQESLNTLMRQTGITVSLPPEILG